MEKPRHADQKLIAQGISEVREAIEREERRQAEERRRAEEWRKAKTAIARKLAVIMTAMLQSGKPYGGEKAACFKDAKTPVAAHAEPGVQ